MRHPASPQYVPGWATLAQHAGRIAVPAQHAATPDGFFSTPRSPAAAALEERIAALEGGVAGLATASGQAALHLAIATIAGAGDHLVASRAMGAAVLHLLRHTLRRFGIGLTLVDPRDTDAWNAAIRPQTRLLLGAAIGPVGLEVLDIAALADIAHAHHLPLLVDASAVTPCLLRPIEHGADLVWHAADTLLSGQDGPGGLLVDGGTFDWQAAHAHDGRYAGLCAAGGDFPGMVFAEESTVAPFALRARHDGLAAFGAAIGGREAEAMLQGLATLGPRLAAQMAGTDRVIDFLLSHAAVAAVCHPRLDTHPDHVLARTLLPAGAGPRLNVQVKGGDTAAGKLLASLQLLDSRIDGDGDGLRSAAAWLAAPGALGMPGAPGDVATLAGEGWLRLCIGLEDPADLCADLGRALALSQKGG